MKINRFGALMLLSLPLLASNCRDKPVDPPKENFDNVLVLNEGGFNSSNGSITSYDRDEKKSTLNAYRDANGSDAGDVVQSMTEVGGKLYLVVNNSGEIQVLNRETLKKEGTIAGDFSPRFMADLGNGKAAVSDFGENLRIINLSTNSIESQIPAPSWTEGVLRKGDNLYVTLPSSGSIWRYSISQNKWMDSVKVEGQPMQLIDGENGQFYSFSTTYPNTECFISLLKEGNNTFTAQDAWNHPQPGYFAELRRRGDNFYLYNGALYAMPVSNPGSSTKVLDMPGRNIYSLGIDPEGGDIYLGDARDYVSNGMAYRYRSTLGILDSFNTGIAPTEFFFNR